MRAIRATCLSRGDLVLENLALREQIAALQKERPRPSSTGKIVALPRVGGLHHRYEWREAA